MFTLWLQTYLNIECDHFTATERNKLSGTITRANIEHISEVSGDHGGRDSP